MIFCKQTFLALIFFFTSTTLSWGQFLISDGGTQTVCAGDFYDSGDVGGDYQSNEVLEMTFCSTSPTDCITIDFTTLDIENGWDFLYIYDGTSNADPLLFTLTGSTPTTVSSSTSNCLTVRFESDGVITAGGWEGTISCGSCPTCSDGIQNGGEGGVDCGGPCPAACPGATCATANVITTLPYSISNLTTEGAGDDYSSTDACGSNYMGGDDYVFEYTPATDTCVNIVLSNTASYTGLFLLDACPDNGAANCIMQATESGGNPAIYDTHLTGGTTYYIVISTWPTPDFTPFDIAIDPVTCPTCNDGIKNGTETGIDCGGTCPDCPGATCATADVIPSLPYVQAGLTTEGAADDYSDASGCGSNYMNGDDYVFEYTAAEDTCVNVVLTNTVSFVGLFILDACPDDPAANCVGSAEESGGNPSILDVHFTAGITYYIVVSTWPTPDFTPFDIAITPLNCPTCSDGIQNGDELGVDCGGAFCVECPASVQDCLGAIPICQDIYDEVNAYSGEGIYPDEINSSGGTCLSSGEKNDVWYTFTAQTTGDLCFSITPNDMSDDYDWAVYNMTNAICTDIYDDISLEVSCNYSGSSGVTGPNGDGDINDEPCLNVTQGEVYVVNVSQFSSSTNGYRIDFGASTSDIYDNTPPSFDSIQVNCAGNELTLFLSENVMCDGVNNNVTNFEVQDEFGSTVPFILIDSVVSQNCAIGGTYDNSYTFYLSDSLTTGSFTFLYGGDPADLTDICENEGNTGSLTTDFNFDPLLLVESDTSYCVPYGVASAEFELNSTGGNAPLQYFSNGNPVTLADLTTVTVPGQYLFQITDNQNCTIEHPLVSFYSADSLIISNDTTIYSESSADLYATSLNAVSTTWTPATYLSCDNCDTTITTPFETIEYTAVVLDENNCSNQGNILITVEIPPIFLPNGFSPNNDGFNDVLYVRGLGISNLDFKIFNKWGDLVFQTTDKSIGWDGTYQDKPLNTGVFMYQMSANLSDGQEIYMTGNVTLFK